MTSNTHQTADTAWPDGVIARYLTVGGATVDITEDSGGMDVVCAGCEWKDWAHSDPYGALPSERWDRVLRDARGIAQAHAEQCRAMPKPSDAPARS